MAAPELDRLRREMAEVDEALRRSIARRLHVARQIGRAKRRQGLAIRVPAVERQVLDRWQAGLVDHGVAVDRARALARWLVDEAVRIQESDAPIRPDRRRRVLVVGGAGAMGRWLVWFARRRGHAVRVADPAAGSGKGQSAGTRALREGARWADLIIVATPVARAPAIYRTLFQRPMKGVLFDVLSVKAPLIPEIRRGRAAGFHITSVHPLFGPRPSLLAGHEVLLLDCGDPKANDAAREFFQHSALAITGLDLDDHDRLTADLQALPRLVGLLFSLALAPAGGGGRPGAATPTFRRQLDVAQVVAGENLELSYGLLQLNPAAPAVLDRLDEGLHELRVLLASSSRRQHRSTLAKARLRLEGAMTPVGAGPARSRRQRRPRRPRARTGPVRGAAR